MATVPPATLAPDPNVGKLTGKSESLANWAGPYVTKMLGEAEALSQQPYQTYQGPLTAGQSGLQQKYFQGLGNLDFPSNLGKSFSASGAPTLPSADGTTGTTTTGPTGIATQYMNPYLSAVLAPQLEEQRRQAQMNLQPLMAKFAGAGAFGGSRQGLVESENLRNLLAQQNRTIGEGYSAAYDKAMQQFNTEQGQAKALADTMAQAGAQQRAIEQEGITADYNEFLQQRDYPMKQLQFRQSMLQGLPISAVSQQYQQPSGLSQFMGGAGGILSFLKEMFPDMFATPAPSATPAPTGTAAP